MNNKVVVGLSGGVDSAVCAALLKNKGYDVLGLYLSRDGSISKDAETVAEHLDIPFKTVSIDLWKSVCMPFIDGYLNGTTPNPCILCNPSVKFPALLNIAAEIGADYIATGHYANTGFSGTRYTLSRGMRENDQSYMLCRLTQEQLKHIIFPLGKNTKEEIRSIAASFSIPVANSPASMEICFIPDNNYAAFIENSTTPPPPGNFINDAGNIIGRHRGIHHYTIGQRRALGIALGKRMFVSKIDPVKNTVTLSDDENILTNTAKVRDVHWVSISETLPLKAAVKIRHSKNETGATITAGGTPGELTINFDKPVRAPTPGQSAVFYDGDYLLGSGFIFTDS